jgi:HSF-type DNA-binding
MKKKKIHQALPTLFLQKTYEMLQEPNIAHIVSWSDDGASFVIKNSLEFSEQVLPAYFKHQKFSSFIRQLNMYDFHKLRGEASDHIYKHSFFMAGRPDLLKEIRRKTSDNSLSVVEKNLPSRLEIPSVMRKMVQIHKKNNDCRSQINVLENKVNDLVEQNKILAGQVWENNEKMKKIEQGLIYFARCIKHPTSLEDFSWLPSIDNTIPKSPTKKQKSNEDIIKSPLSYSAFEEEIEQLQRDKFESTIQSPLHVYSPDMYSDSDKLEYLLNS